MRSSALLLAIAFMLTACGGGGGDSAAFCDVMQEFVDLAETIESPDADLEALQTQITDLVSEAEDTAPAEIADIIDSTDPEDQETITTFVRDECGLELPGL